jgi:hypothetical protein
MSSREPLLVKNGLVVYPGSVSYPALASMMSADPIAGATLVNDFGSTGLFNWSKSGDRGW